MEDNYKLKPLTTKEKTLVEPIIKGLRLRQGKDNAISNTKIREGISKNLGIDLTEPRVRKIINYIRVNGLLKRLAACGKGYYVESNDKKWKTYLKTIEHKRDTLDYLLKKLETQ